MNARRKLYSPAGAVSLIFLPRHHNVALGGIGRIGRICKFFLRVQPGFQAGSDTAILKIEQAGILLVARLIWGASRSRSIFAPLPAADADVNVRIVSRLETSASKSPVFRIHDHHRPRSLPMAFSAAFWIARSIVRTTFLPAQPESRRTRTADSPGCLRARIHAALPRSSWSNGPFDSHDAR